MKSSDLTLLSNHFVVPSTITTDTFKDNSSRPQTNKAAADTSAYNAPSDAYSSVLSSWKEGLRDFRSFFQLQKLPFKQASAAHPPQNYYGPAHTSIPVPVDTRRSLPDSMNLSPKLFTDSAANSQLLPTKDEFAEMRLSAPVSRTRINSSIAWKRYEEEWQALYSQNSQLISEKCELQKFISSMQMKEQCLQDEKSELIEKMEFLERRLAEETKLRVQKEQENRSLAYKVMELKSLCKHYASTIRLYSCNEIERFSKASVTLILLRVPSTSISLLVICRKDISVAVDLRDIECVEQCKTIPVSNWSYGAKELMYNTLGRMMGSRVSSYTHDPLLTRSECMIRISTRRNESFFLVLKDRSYMNEVIFSIKKFQRLASYNYSAYEKPRESDGLQALERLLYGPESSYQRSISSKAGTSDSPDTEGSSNLHEFLSHRFLNGGEALANRKRLVGSTPHFDGLLPTAKSSPYPLATDASCVKNDCLFESEDKPIGVESPPPLSTEPSNSNKLQDGHIPVSDTPQAVSLGHGTASLPVCSSTDSESIPILVSHVNDYGSRNGQNRAPPSFMDSPIEKARLLEGLVNNEGQPFVETLQKPLGSESNLEAHPFNDSRTDRDALPLLKEPQVVPIEPSTAMAESSNRKQMDVLNTLTPNACYSPQTTDVERDTDTAVSTFFEESSEDFLSEAADKPTAGDATSRAISLRSCIPLIPPNDTRDATAFDSPTPHRHFADKSIVTSQITLPMDFNSSSCYGPSPPMPSAAASEVADTNHIPSSLSDVSGRQLNGVFSLHPNEIQPPSDSASSHGLNPALLPATFTPDTSDEYTNKNPSSVSLKKLSAAATLTTDISNAASPSDASSLNPVGLPDHPCDNQMPVHSNQNKSNPPCNDTPNPPSFDELPLSLASTVVRPPLASDELLYSLFSDKASSHALCNELLSAQTYAPPSNNTLPLVMADLSPYTSTNENASSSPTTEIPSGVSVNEVSHLPSDEIITLSHPHNSIDPHLPDETAYPLPLNDFASSLSTEVLNPFTFIFT